MDQGELKKEIVEAFARLAYAIIMMDGVVDESEERFISEKLSDSPIIDPLKKLIEESPEVMITECYQTLFNQLGELDDATDYRPIFNSLENLADAGEVLDEDDADILLSVLTNLKNHIK